MNNNINPAKILVIDDEAAIRQSFADYLEDLEFMVLTAENGRIGLELLEREQPQVVLVDLRMPEADGLEVLGRGREIAPDTPKIVVSGANRIDEVVEALRLGAWDYLIKPVKDLSILGHAVDKALEKARLLRENRAYQDHLEALVHERTAELEEANTDLANINVRLHKIVESTRRLSVCADVNRFGSRLLDEFAEHMLASGGSIYMVEDKGLRLLHALPPGHPPPFIPFPLKEGSIFRRTIDEKRTFLIRDVAREPGIEPSGWSGYQDGSVLAFPLPNEQGDIVGVLTLHNKALPPFLDQDREIGAILASYSCETLRAVRAFEALHKSERQYRTLFEKTNDAIFIVERNTGRYLDANKAAAELAGRPLEELRRLTTRDVTPEGAERLLAIADSDETADLGTVTYHRPDNTHRIAKFSMVPLDSKSVIGIARDITRDLEIEDQLRQSQKMEAIGTLAGGIAHDFNNILTGILGYAELGLMGSDPGNPVMNKLEAIRKSGERARDLVARILAFSRAEEQVASPVRVDLILREALKLLRPAIPSTIEIQQRIDKNCTILGDPTRIHQVIMNLCTNANHAMYASGGVLDLSLAIVKIGGESAVPLRIPPGGYVKLTVSDSGPGIPRENLARIFDPYFTTKEKSKGTGLGLSVVHGIVRSHGGTVTVKSKIGSGTEFEVYLPVAAADDNANGKQEKLESQIPGGNEHILLVDDEEVIVAVEKEMLEALGYLVTATDKADEALTIFEGSPERFDLVITDMTMPKMTGVRLAEKLKELNPGIRIVICSGYNETISRESSREHGVEGYIQKPVIMDELAETVRNIIDGNKG
ncbi:response regulator [Desulfococcaceae bacterium HSG8]|nr:response regulator [Desulfococcaceae bacterium HSG8]